LLELLSPPAALQSARGRRTDDLCGRAASAGKPRCACGRAASAWKPHPAWNALPKRPLRIFVLKKTPGKSTALIMEVKARLPNAELRSCVRHVRSLVPSVWVCLPIARCCACLAGLLAGGWSARLFRAVSGHYGGTRSTSAEVRSCKKRRRCARGCLHVWRAFADCPCVPQQHAERWRKEGGGAAGTGAYCKNGPGQCALLALCPAPSPHPRPPVFRPMVPFTHRALPLALTSPPCIIPLTCPRCPRVRHPSNPLSRTLGRHRPKEAAAATARGPKL